MQNDFLTPYKEDSGIPPYLPFPRFLIPLDLSNDAKVLYALLFDRAGISRENGYIEPDGRIRLYFTLEEAKGKAGSNKGISGIGTQRPDYPQKTRAWPPGGYYAEYFALWKGA